MIISLEDLPKIRKRHKGQTIVFALGSFDIWHIGHLAFLKKLRSEGDIVVVAVSSDKNIRMRKGKGRPVLSQRERLQLVDANRFVDYVLLKPHSLLGSPHSVERILPRLQPDIFFSRERSWKKEKERFKKHGTDIHVVAMPKLNSTTRILKKIVNSHK